MFEMIQADKDKYCLRVVIICVVIHRGDIVLNGKRILVIVPFSSTYDCVSHAGNSTIVILLDESIGKSCALLL